jgi:streptomycin 6-kinase
MRAFWDWLERLWCRAIHPDPMWPIHGHYGCPRCGRVYPVPWHEGDEFARRMVTGTNVTDQKLGAVIFEFQKTRG